ncbi:TPA: hypothetical protein SJ233_003030 [Legionella pneumophila]|nr:hypothetical protein [Legionella pneumophila]
MNEIERQIESMLENALDFFRVASQEIESNPKYSSIHFWSGFELILKARVCSEHWSFMIANNNPTLKDFIAGDFYSKNFQELCVILEKISDTPIQKKHFNRLETIRKHRNRWVHFYNHDDVHSKQNDLITDHLHGWYILDHYISGKWSQVFIKHQLKFDSIYKEIREKYCSYLTVAYEYLKPQINKKVNKNNRLLKCSKCNYYSCLRPKYQPELYFESNCELCGTHSKNLYFKCNTCASCNVCNLYDTCKCKKCGQEYPLSYMIQFIKQNLINEDYDVHCSCGSSSLLVIGSEIYCIKCKNQFSEDILNECPYCKKLGPEEMNRACVLCENYEPCNEDIYPRK